MSPSRRRRPNPPGPAAPEPAPPPGEEPSWFQSAQGPPATAWLPTGQAPPPPPPYGGAPMPPPAAPTAPVPEPHAQEPHHQTPHAQTPRASAPPALMPPVPPPHDAAGRPGAPPTATGADAEPSPGEGPAESPDGPRRRRSSRRRPMSTRRRVALRLLAGLVLTGALLGVRGYDAISRYEAREPPPAVRTVPVGQTATLENGRWRLAAIGPMPNPPESDRPERAWLRMTLEVTPLNKDGIRYRFGLPALELDDGDGHTWRVEVLRRPEEDLRQGEPAEFTLVAVAPKDLAERVRLVLWTSGRSGIGPALRFDR